MQRVILVGKAAAGKDYLRTALRHEGFKVDVSVTTRAPREQEIDGTDYRFITREKFNDMVARKQLYEHVEFNGNGYGTVLDSWHSSQIFIMTPSGVAQLSRRDRDVSCIIYLDIPEEVRRKRLLARNDTKDRVERRIRADEEDFHDFTDWDWVVQDPYFKPNELVQLIDSILTTNE